MYIIHVTQEPECEGARDDPGGPADQATWEPNTHRARTQAAMDLMNERRVIKELIELYKDRPCLWDATCEAYKNIALKKKSWDILALKLKELDPAANVASAKKKIDSLRISHAREFRKVQESKKRIGSGAGEVHRPSLWYYNLLSFLEKKLEDKEAEKAVDPLKIDDGEDLQLSGIKRKQKITKEKIIELKKEKLIDAAHNLSRRKDPNPFGVYVGKKIDDIQSSLQKDLAEKLISDVLFLAKSNMLTFGAKIDVPSNSPYQCFASSPPQSSSSSQNSSKRFTDQSPTHTEQNIDQSISYPVLHSYMKSIRSKRSSQTYFSQNISHQVSPSLSPVSKSPPS